jgi:uncharacterized protein (DUF885 family)
VSDTQVNQLADELLQLSFDANPLWPTTLGLRSHLTGLPDHSESGEHALRGAALDVASRAAALDPATLSTQDAVTRDVVVHRGHAIADEVDTRFVEYTVSDLFVAPAAELLTLLPKVPVTDAETAQAYLTRLGAVPDYLDDVAERHRAGVAAGRTPVAHLTRAAIDHIDRYLADPANDPLADHDLDDTAAARRERLLADVVRPAFAAYRDVLADEILGAGRPAERPGVCWLPDGEGIYRTLCRLHTTTDRTPEELHQTGLDIIAELTDEYARLGASVFGTSDQREIFAHLTDDPAMRWRDADELLAAAREAVARAEAEAPNWFGRVADTPCAVEPIPAASAPGAPAAYYLWPALDGSRPGTYFANTDRAHERDRFVAEVMAFHEAVPGHHFQLSIAQQLTELPMLRRIDTPTAYAEGWGLYTERLAEEMGLYTSDTYRLGMLAMDSMRAGRLVVDTGLHAKGWSRAQAVTFLRENTPMAALEIGNEIDRYIAYAGQALAYMVGRLEINRLRAKATERLGAAFDPRTFHDTLLGSGALPMSVLDQLVDRWIDGQLSRA